MLSTVKGYFENGKIQLLEMPPVKNKTKVIITFLEEQFNLTTSKKRIPGAFKGKISLPDNFNEPLADLTDYQ